MRWLRCAGRGRLRDGSATDAGPRLGPECASLDPVGQGGDLLGLEFSLGGHLHVPLVADRLDQRALVGLARHDDRPALAPLEHRVADVEPQASLVLLGPVALQAVVSEHRADLRLEELLLSRLELALIGLRIASRTDDWRSSPRRRAPTRAKFGPEKTESEDKLAMSCSARPRFDQYLTSATRSGLSRTIVVKCPCAISDRALS